MKMIAIIDYGAGNILSVQKALDYIGEENILTNDIDVLMSAEAAILPGVGSFADAMNNLRAQGLDTAIKSFIATGKPFLGICLGLQVLFERSEEGTGVEGLSVLKGEIKRIPSAEGLKVPHIGWNSLEETKGELFDGLKPEPYVYFVHSYYLEAAEDIVTSKASYGVEIHASVQKENVFACQFHPEKSGELGIKMLRNFCKLVK